MAKVEGSNPFIRFVWCLKTSETDVARHRRHERLAEWLVVAARIEGQLAQDLALGGEDADVAVGDEDEHAPALVGSAEADVVQAAAVAQRDGAAGVGLV